MLRVLLGFCHGLWCPKRTVLLDLIVCFFLNFFWTLVNYKMHVVWLYVAFLQDLIEVVAWELIRASLNDLDKHWKLIDTWVRLWILLRSSWLHFFRLQFHWSVQIFDFFILLLENILFLLRYFFKLVDLLFLKQRINLVCNILLVYINQIWSWSVLVKIKFLHDILGWNLILL
jgi:hypothetical protein